MKILVDSCAWSLLLRRKSTSAASRDEQLIVATLKEAIRDGQVLIVGPIRQEVLSGIKELAQFDKLRSALRAFEDEPLTTFHFEEAARLYNYCRSHGVECGSTDIVICVVAIERQCEVLTYDKGLKRCMDVLRAESVMK